MCDLYQYSVKFRLHKDLTLENADAITDALYEASESRNCNGFRDYLDGDAYVVEVSQATYKDNDFEDALVRGQFIWMIQDVQYECVGYGQRYYYKIENGVLYDCGTIQQPDNEWQPFGHWLRVLGQERNEDV